MSTMSSSLFTLRVAMAHQFIQRGANGNLPKHCCLACGLSSNDKVHDLRYVKAQRDGKQSDVRHYITFASRSLDGHEE